MADSGTNSDACVPQVEKTEVNAEVAVGKGKEPASDVPVQLSLDERYNLIRSIGEECITEADLRNLLEKKPTPPVAYDGFEPSGRMHIAQGIMKAINVNKLTEAGCEFIFWVADWFALMNNKMGGDLKKIQNVGKYMIEVWKAAGMDMTKVKFLWSSEEINKNSNQYWSLCLDIARRNTLARIVRCSQIMGRTDTDELSAAQIFYPCMQCADIFFLKADICQLGMDQRKVNVLAREYCDQIKRKNKPIIVSHHMLMGLIEGQEKMSKSDPNSAIFVEDSAAEVNVKIKKAFCPPQQVEKNPIFDYLKHLIWADPHRTELTVYRSEKNGGNLTYKSYGEMEKDYMEGLLHPGDVKPAVAAVLNDLIDPIRKHFEKDKDAKKLLQTIKKYKITK